MPDVLISEQATEDLAGIWAYIAADNPLAANRTLDKISDHCLSYAHQPQLGEQRPNLGNGFAASPWACMSSVIHCLLSSFGGY